MGWRYEYELEGYQLPSGWYLPDFFIPDMGFCEVKPVPATERQRRLCEELTDAVDQRTWLLVGSPDYAIYEHRDPGDDELGPCWDGSLIWSSRARFWWHAHEYDIETHLREDPLYTSAVNAARSASFGTR